MMGIGELAASAGTYLVAKASGKLAENLGGEVGNRIMRLWDAVKGKLAGKDALVGARRSSRPRTSRAIRARSRRWPAKRTP
jgi:hypothetical protein